MFKLKKIPNSDISKFVGVSFAYSGDKYTITSFGIHDTTEQPCFFLDGLTTRRIEVVNFHRNIEEGKFKIIGNVGV